MGERATNCGGERGWNQGYLEPTVQYYLLFVYCICLSPLCDDTSSGYRILFHFVGLYMLFDLEQSTTTATRHENTKFASER